MALLGAYSKPKAQGRAAIECPAISRQTKSQRQGIQLGFAYITAIWWLFEILLVG
jgi:hypothetical protein